MEASRVLLAAIVFLGALTPAVVAQTNASLAGDYNGVLGGALHLKLHIAQAPDGSLSGTLDSVDQGAMGIVCADFHVNGSSLDFRVPSVNGSWKGTLAADTATLSGTWTQGNSLPLTFTRDTFAAADKPSPVDGLWLGTVAVSGQSLRAQIKVKSDKNGREYCTFESLDQGALDWECEKVTLRDKNFSFEVPKVQGHWSGTLSDDGRTLSGSWVQEGTYPLTLSRQATAAPAASSAGNAMPPVKVDELESVLNQDLAAARVPIFRPGALSERAGTGVAIGVVQGGVRRVFVFGKAHPDSIFEIGSITKTFTGLLLARMVAAGKVRFDEPVRELLPQGAVPKPEGAEITLLDLATQHSGLPRMPNNFHPADPRNPYADYRAEELYHYLASHGVGKAAAPAFGYSNLGVGLLGQALANRAHETYAELLGELITHPLGMASTMVAVPAEMRARFIAGHDAAFLPAHEWDLDALAGAGAVRSTAADMLTYLEAQLHPERVPQLTGPIDETHRLRADAGPGLRIGLAWLYVEKQGYYWHNGGTGGFTSYAFFDPKHDCAGIVLYNATLNAEGSFADRLGEHIRQRLTGVPAVTLGR